MKLPPADGAVGDFHERFVDEREAFGAYAKAARSKRGSPRELDEIFVNPLCEPHVLWRAVDEHGTELDVLLQKRRDNAAAKCLFMSAAFRPRAAQSRHSPVAQLPGCKRKDPRTRIREARVCQSGRAGELTIKERHLAFVAHILFQMLCHLFKLTDVTD